MSKEKTHLIVNSQISGGVRRFVHNGRDTIAISSYTLPYDIVMKGIMYPKDEIERSFKELHESPAPFGHPHINGQLISAKSISAYLSNFKGAYNMNPEIVGNRVKVDKYIDVEMAKQSDEGKELLSRIDAYENGQGKPISTSVGLYLHKEKAPEGLDYEYIARDMTIDHDAILLNEAPAADPTKGVGALIANSKSNIEVIDMDKEEKTLETNQATTADEVSTQMTEQEVSMFKKLMKALTGSKDQNHQEETKMSDKDKTQEVNAEVTAEDFKSLKERLSKLEGQIGELIKKVDDKRSAEANHKRQELQDHFGAGLEVNSLSDAQVDALHKNLGKSEKVPSPAEMTANSQTASDYPLVD